jgi:hypothetical protein
MQVLKMEAARPSEMLAHVYRTTHGHIAEHRGQSEPSVQDCSEQLAGLQRTVIRTAVNRLARLQRTG